MNKKELTDKISAANLSYSKGLPFLTDTEYDILWKQLFTIDPDNKLLYHTANDPTIAADHRPHSRQLYGTNKAFNVLDLKPYLTRFGNTELVLEPKYDGVAGVLYRNKSNYSLILEGDGIKGRDISHHFERITLSFEPKNIESVEIVIPNALWNKSYGKNQRNTVAGWLARKEIPYNHVVKFISHNYGILNEKYLFKSYDLLEEKLLSLYNLWSQTYPLDGIMIKVLDESRRITAGHTSTTYHWSIAWKPPIQIAETIVTNIEWNVSRSGRVIPTVIYKPIELCNTLNSRVTGNNAKWIFDRNISIGDTITIGKAGEIIPKIINVKYHKVTPSNSDNLKQAFAYPTPQKPVKRGKNTVEQFSGSATPQPSLKPLKTQNMDCPVCNNELTWKGVDLVCNSSDCIVQLSKSLEYFYSDKGMDVKDIGEHRISDLLQNYSIRQTLIDYPWALLDPIHYNIYDDIYFIWGKVKTNNYIDSLDAINGKKHAVHFLASLGYPKLGYKTALKLYYYITDGIKSPSIPKLAVSNFIMAASKFEIADNTMTNFTFASVPPVPRITYCITGTMSQSRNDFITYLSSYQWSFSNQVSRHTDYLIVGDKPGRTKTRKAEELSVVTITEVELLNILNKDEEKDYD